MSNKPLKKGDRKTPWGKREMTHKRSKRELQVRNLFRIYCEGAVTEPEYFRAFPINRRTTKVFAKGYGRSKTSLVEFVVDDLREKHFLIGQKEYDRDRQNWVVFDFDWKGETNECEDFKSAVTLAESQGIKAAISNDAFEIWFLLHFQFVDTRLHRTTVYEKLSEKLGFNYDEVGKQRGISKQLYRTLFPLQANALRNARGLAKKMQSIDLCQRNPFTTVHELVVELNKNLRR